MKQETLKEALKNELEFVHNSCRNFDFDLGFKTGGLIGAKWQQEQDKNKFNELELFINEVKDRIDSFEYSVNQQSYLSEYITKWFEQFKKK